MFYRRLLVSLLAPAPSSFFFYRPCLIFTCVCRSRFWCPPEVRRRRAAVSADPSSTELLSLNTGARGLRGWPQIVYRRLPERFTKITLAHGATRARVRIAVRFFF